MPAGERQVPKDARAWIRGLVESLQEELDKRTTPEERRPPPRLAGPGAYQDALRRAWQMEQDRQFADEQVPQQVGAFADATPVPRPGAAPRSPSTNPARAILEARATNAMPIEKPAAPPQPISGLSPNDQSVRDLAMSLQGAQDPSGIIRAAAGQQAPGVSPVPQQQEGSFIDRLLTSAGMDPLAGDKLLRFGLQLMAASEPRPGAQVGPTFAGALGRAGLGYVADERGLEQQQYERETGASAAARKAFESDREFNLDRKRVEIEGIRAAQSEETKRLLIEIRQRNDDLSHQVALMRLDTERQRLVRQVMKDAQDQITELQTNPPFNAIPEGADVDEVIRQKTLEIERARDALISEITGRPVGQSATGGGAQVTLPSGETVTASRTGKDQSGNTLYEYGGKWYRQNPSQ